MVIHPAPGSCSQRVGGVNGKENVWCGRGGGGGLCTCHLPTAHRMSDLTPSMTWNSLLPQHGFTKTLDIPTCINI